MPIREPAELHELLFVRQRLVVADVEPRMRVDVDPHAASLREAERRPAYERGDRPREVVVQARQRDVGRRIRVVDRMYLVVAHDRLSKVDLPAEERVDDLGDRYALLPLLGR